MSAYRDNVLSEMAAIDREVKRRQAARAAAVTTLKCDKCKREFPPELLDAKPPPGSDPETADWTVLECRDCYGPGWSHL